MGGTCHGEGRQRCQNRSGFDLRNYKNGNTCGTVREDRDVKTEAVLTYGTTKIGAGRKGKVSGAQGSQPTKRRGHVFSGIGLTIRRQVARPAVFIWGEVTVVCYENSDLLFPDIQR
jgi:hypothetical protein